LGALATPIDDPDLRENIARAFKSVLTSESGREALATYPLIHRALLTGLRQEDEFVRGISSEQLIVLIEQELFRAAFSEFVLSGDGFVSLLKSLSDPSTTVAENVAKNLVSLGAGNDAIVERYFDQESFLLQKEMAKVDSTIQIRVLSLAAKMANLSPVAFERFHSCGLLDEVSKLLTSETEDPLLQMSAFAVITEENFLDEILSRDKSSRSFM
jgi:hypothetical protein